jgi:hypothetical protein
MTANIFYYNGGFNRLNVHFFQQKKSVYSGGLNRCNGNFFTEKNALAEKNAQYLDLF